MSSYKLTYFNFTGLGEPVRFMLAYGGIKFEDNRISIEDWPKKKPDMPLQQMPVLEIDGKSYHQSSAIGRFFAKKFNIYGKDIHEELAIDIAVASIDDLRSAIVSWYWCDDQKRKDEMKEPAFARGAFLLDKFEAQVKSNGGHFVGNEITWADVVFASMYEYLSHAVGEDICKDHPTLRKLANEIRSLPDIKAYLDSRGPQSYSMTAKK